MNPNELPFPKKKEYVTTLGTSGNYFFFHTEMKTDAYPRK